MFASLIGISMMVLASLLVFGVFGDVPERIPVEQQELAEYIKAATGVIIFAIGMSVAIRR